MAFTITLTTSCDGKSQAWILERRASVGPCYRPGLPFEGPSGITIHMPKKSTSISRPSGISINISRRNISTKSLFQNIDLGPENEETGDKFFVCLKGTLVNVQNKIKRNKGDIINYYHAQGSLALFLIICSMRTLPGILWSILNLYSQHQE
ncbi:unnamed protein product [Leptidea sinapis]|uniref:Uncharacterized protein n=1 Tax=Leptidea sinapis TaxID=189913 RepID=A0A5E4PQ22_9NEOP|nr:unnamed protein product [Leptidea sinapis]